MKLSELKYGSWFLSTVGAYQTKYMKTNRVEGGMRICITLRGELIDFNEEAEIKLIKEEKKHDEDHD